VNTAELTFDSSGETWQLEVIGGKDLWGFFGAVGNGGAIGGAAGAVIGGVGGLILGPGFIAGAGAGALIGGILGGAIGAVAYIRS